MPYLVRDIDVELIEEISGDIHGIMGVTGIFGIEDYLEVYSLIAYLQDYVSVMTLTKMNKPLNFGLVNTEERITLEISY